MAPQAAKSLRASFRASFRRKKAVVDQTPKDSVNKEADEEELAKLLELKENMGDDLPPCYTDATLLSFLRARSLNVKEAEKLVRVDENVKILLRVSDYQPNEELQLYNFSGVIGYDKEGSLVRIINLGDADSKGIMHMVPTIDGLRMLISMMEKDLQRVHNETKDARNIHEVMYIINLENLGLSQITYKPAFDSAAQLLKLIQDHYHDALKWVYFVNAPSFFSSVFKLFKPFIQDVLYKKMKILDHDNWKTELLTQIDASVLPQNLGGDRVDSNGDPSCKEIVPVGATIPESLYATNFLDLNDPEVVVTTVPAGATLNFRFPVRQVGMIFKWHIQAKDNDIALALYREPFQTGAETPRSRKKREEDMSRFEALTPVVRSQCHICPEEGACILMCTGNIILHFDNTYSWMNSKEVYFKMSVSVPTEAEKNLYNIKGSLARSLNKMTISC